MIWHLIDSSTVGGAERHIGIIVHCLRKNGWPAEAILYRKYGPNPWLDQLASQGVPFRVLDGSLRGLITSLARARPDLLHVHGYKAGILGRLPARLLGIPVVTTFHSGERSHGGKLLLYEWTDELTAFVGERIAVSPAVQARLPFGSTVIKNFVPNTPAPAAEPFPLRIAFIGRLTLEKGPDLFCRIAALRRGRAEWHVYGDGPLRRDLQKQFGDVVQFHGVMADLAQVWPTIGAVVMPSRFEGLPYAALEALSFGVPVLAARVGGLPGVVVEAETGWLFESGNVEEAVGKIDAWLALAEPEQIDMRRRCWTHVTNCFSEASELPKLLDVYRRAGYAPALAA